MEGIDTIRRCYDAVASGGLITDAEARDLLNVPDEALPHLLDAAGRLTRAMRGPEVDVEQLHNIKKNACSEDCSFCAQSAFFNTDTETYRLPPAEEIIEGARGARERGADSYCLVAAWREPPPADFERVCGIVRRIRADIGIEVECSLGFLTARQAGALKRAGARRYNHNLETAPSKFPQICTTHTFADRVATLRRAREAGLELCTGGIIGLGETRAQRLELALEIRRIRPEEVTINILVPVPGTPLELQAPLPPGEISRMFALMRFLLPRSIVKISGGRETATDDAGEALLGGGADGIITNGYLTMPGNEPDRDAEVIRRARLEA